MISESPEVREQETAVTGRRVGTGGTVELLILTARSDGLWEALARPARRLHPGVEIEFTGLTARIVSDPVDGLVVVELTAPNIDTAIEIAGEVPLPPYFKGSLDDSDRYQTMFARVAGSAAAPTAGLHFTPEVVDRLDAKGIAIAGIDLHVGIDTFRPIAVDTVEDHRMHSEWCSVPKRTATAVQATRDRGGRVVAVGTTVVRTLETMGNEDGTVTAGDTDSSIFLMPGSRFRVVDAMVTNVHVPGSTLVVLVAAFMGDRWREAYSTALGRGYRFLSFGDAMYAERPSP